MMRHLGQRFLTEADTLMVTSLLAAQVGDYSTARLRCPVWSQGSVSTSGAPSVMAMLCSKCVQSDPSRVTTVH